MTDNFLAQLSKDAYNDDIQVLGYHTATIFDKNTDTTCFILSNDKDQIVVFRGTKVTVTNYQDMITNLRCKPLHGVHKGFLEAYNSVSKALHVAVDTNKTTVFTGHSLGGALAQIGHTDFMLPSSRCVVFGAPRVFQKDLARTFNRMEGKRIIRYETASDPIPYLPPYSFGYRHIGTMKGGTSFIDFLTTNLKNKLQAHCIDNYINNINQLTESD